MERSTHGAHGRVVLAACVLAAIASDGSGGATALAARRRPATHWVATWTASPSRPADAGPSSVGVTNTTIRQVVYASIGGRRVRVRFTNTFGAAPLTIDAATVGLAAAGGAVVEGTTMPVTFAGVRSITIPRGARVVSDPVDLRVDADSNVTVSLYVAGATGPLTWHPIGSTTTYVGPGDRVAIEAPGAFPFTAFSYFLLDGLEVEAPKRVFAVVSLGDSITDGLFSSTDANRRYPNFLARRLLARGRRTAVLDAGISGNRVLNDSASGGPSSLSRFDRDVLTQPGVRTLILLQGINDIGFSEIDPDPLTTKTPVTAEEIITGHEQLIAQAHRHGIRVLGATLLPFEGAFYYSATAEAKRQAVNDWIRNRSPYDGVIDLDAIMQDPANALRMRAEYDSGDRLHPGDAGFEAMAAAVDLRCLRPGRPRRGGKPERCTVFGRRAP